MYERSHGEEFPPGKLVCKDPHHASPFSCTRMLVAFKYFHVGARTAERAGADDLCHQYVDHDVSVYYDPTLSSFVTEHLRRE